MLSNFEWNRTLYRPTLTEKCNLDSDTFFNPKERDSRLRDFQEANGGNFLPKEKVTNSMLLEFLTLGDLVNLLNRNRSNLREVRSLEISRVTSIIKNARLISVRNSISHPMRGSSPGDETRLISYGRVLPIEAPNMVWTPLWDRWTACRKSWPIIPLLMGFSSFNFPDEQYEVKNNLPNADYDFDTGGFIGRKSEQGELTDLMKQHPVVTILGVGGMG